MKRTASTALVGLFVCAGAAQAGGLVETGKGALALGWTTLNESNDETSDETDDQSYAFFGIDASYSVPLAPTWSMQVDAVAERYMVDGAAIDNVTKLGAAGLHLSYRIPEQYAVGILGGAGFGETNRFHGHTNAWWLGGEGQYYLGNTTLYSQLAYTKGDVEDTEEELNSTWMVRGVVRHFITDNSKVQAELAYVGSDDAIDDEDKVTNLAWGLSYERQLMDSSWYYTAGYRGDFVDTTTEGEELTEHSLYLKFSFQFEDLSLKANDRTGATFDQPLIALTTTNWLEPLD